MDTLRYLLQTLENCATIGAKKGKIRTANQSPATPLARHGGRRCSHILRGSTFLPSSFFDRCTQQTQTCPSPGACHSPSRRLPPPRRIPPPPLFTCALSHFVLTAPPSSFYHSFFLFTTPLRYLSQRYLSRNTQLSLHNLGVDVHIPHNRARSLSLVDHSCVDSEPLLLRVARPGRHATQRLYLCRDALATHTTTTTTYSRLRVTVAPSRQAAAYLTATPATALDTDHVPAAARWA